MLSNSLFKNSAADNLSSAVSHTILYRQYFSKYTLNKEPFTNGTILFGDTTKLSGRFSKTSPKYRRPRGCTTDLNESKWFHKYRLLDLAKFENKINRVQIVKS